MNICLEFQKIVDDPRCAIAVNDTELYQGPVLPYFCFDHAIDQDTVKLKITHWDKSPQDTVVKDGIIIRDRSFELKRIIVDHYDIEELIWCSEFVSQDGDTYKSCLFFGPNGTFNLIFSYPILRWILKSRHDRDGNDPNWEQDYNYYVNACQILDQISTK